MKISVGSKKRLDHARSSIRSYANRIRKRLKIGNLDELEERENKRENEKHSRHGDDSIYNSIDQD